jgi:trk system potassium uptake protein TrkH
MKFFYHKLSILLEFLVSGCYLFFYLSLNEGPQSSLFSGLDPSSMLKVVGILVWIVPFVVLFSIFAHLIYFRSIETLFRRNIFSLILIIPLFITLGNLEFTFWLGSVHLFSTLLSFYEFPSKSKKYHNQMEKTLWSRLTFRPAQLVLFSFIGLILIGAGLLMLPVSTRADFHLSFIDAVFMSTSASCVTGLALFGIGSEFSIVGQLITLALIQIGGLGIMTLSSSLTILLGRSLGVKQQVMLQGLLEISSLSDLISMIIEIIKLTLFIELCGAILLTGAFIYDGQDLSEAMFNGVFHSISAFCNAGFSLYPNSLENFQDNFFINTVIMVLIIFGGLGFIVIKDLREHLFAKRFHKKRGFVHLTLHTKIVLVTNLGLIFLGTFAFFFSEFLNSLDDFSIIEKFLISLFQSVTTRTAGFNTIDFSALHPHTIYFMCLLMFIGASPGSTGGGIKTTTFAILIQSVKTTLQGRKQVEFFERKIPNLINVRATAVAIISLVIVSVFILIMIKVEPQIPFLSLFFETVSAFGTVGLSLGITPELGQAGKIFIIILMFIGRVGPLTLVLAFSQVKSLPNKVEFTDGRVLIG